MEEYMQALEMDEESYAKMQQENRQKLMTQFKRSFEQMIATSEAAYQGDIAWGGKSHSLRDYEADEIHRIVSCGDAIEQASLSEYFFATNGLYKRIIVHYATFLMYAWLLVPSVKNVGKNKISDPKISKRYYDAADFCTNFQISRKCALFARDILVKGAYYGLVIEKGEKVVILDLPFDYCRSRFKNDQDIDIIEFNLDFFKKIRDDKARQKILDSYPKIIQKAWRKYNNSNDPHLKWFFIPPELGIYFCFFEERPFFLDLIPLLNDLDDYKDIDKQRNAQALKRILVQEVPHDGMKLVFEPQEAEAMHAGAINMLENNRDTDVITSYAKVSLLDMSSKDDEKTEIVNVQDLIYSSAGMSKELFFATTAAGIEYSVCNDLALVMVLGQRFAHFFTVLLNTKFADKRVDFRLIILPLSYYNAKDYNSMAREMASFGYSFLAPILATGIDQANLASLKALENDLLNLDEILKPLQSSYTQSGKKAGESMDAVAESGDPNAKAPSQTQEETKTEEKKETGGEQEK